jgi:hypothetical protein
MRHRCRGNQERPISRRDIWVGGGLIWIALSALALLTALLAASGITGLLYAFVYVLAVAPGAMLGRRLFGRSHAAGWVVGALIGYGATQLALWLPVFLSLASPLSFAASWLLQAVLLIWISRRISAPVVTLPAWTGSDMRALALVLLLVPALMGPPYFRLGRADESGTRWYRAYFTADFVWHTALAAEIGRYDSPPRNPYMASRTIHYYWAYFLLPSVVAHDVIDDVEGVLKANAMLSGALVIAMVFLLTATAVPTAGAAAIAVALVVLATSAEGAYMLQQLWSRGRPFAALADTNIDAISAWQFRGLRIDGIARGLWYNPQHSVSCALALVGILVASVAGAGAGRGAIWVAGTALGMATMFNPFVGALFCGVYGMSVAIDAVRHAQAVRIVLRHAQAAVPVLLALAWSAINEVADGAGAAVQFGWLIGIAGNNTLTSLLISTGPVLLPALAGLWPWRPLPRQPLVVAGIGVALSLLLMHTMTITESSWVGFRTGQTLQLMLPVLLARVLWALAQWHAIAPISFAAAILIAGLPTTAIDTYNAQDTDNRRMGPGFHWTLPVTRAQSEAFDWLQTSTPEDAVVQMEPILRGRGHWSLIPTFAHRRMSAGLPISLLPMPEYEQGSRQVQQLYKTADPREAWQLARARKIDYLYVDPADRAAYPEGVAKFDAQRAYFERAFDNGSVTIYAVK